MNERMSGIGLAVVVASGCVLLAAATHAEGHRHRFMRTFSDAEREAPHVKASSLPSPHAFTDGQWQGIIAASDGYTYFGFSSHHEAYNAQFYRYHPDVGELEHLIDVGAWCGDEEYVGIRNTQGKIHSWIYEDRGRLYLTTSGGNPKHFRGGNFLAYDLESGAFIDFGRHEHGLTTMVFCPLRQRMYGIGDNRLVYYDLETEAIVDVGVIEDSTAHTRNLIVDAEGIVYGSTWGGVIYRYDPLYNIRSALMPSLPLDPEAPRHHTVTPMEHPPLLRYDEALDDMVATDARRPGSWHKWGPMLWDGETQWWYGVTKGQEYLFRFRPPKSRYSHRARVQGLVSLAFRPPEQRVGNVSNGLALKGRTLYYISYPVWQPQAHLTSYNIDTGLATDHGPIVMEDGRRLSEMHGLVVGSDGKLHGNGMVWSIEGEDPANDWPGATRAGCYIHCRFITIDVNADFVHADSARTWE